MQTPGAQNGSPLLLSPRFQSLSRPLTNRLNAGIDAGSLSDVTGDAKSIDKPLSLKLGKEQY